MFQIKIIPHLLHFKQPAGTSRGIYNTRKVWYIVLTDSKQPNRFGIGECAPLPKLSCDDVPNYELLLKEACIEFEQQEHIDYNKLKNYPSILFGLECAVQHFKQSSTLLWNTPFTHEKCGIPINGLIWMGTFEEMFSRIEEKIQAGFRCIKLKIGAIDFQQELHLLEHIRKQYSPAQIEIRVDANGAFSPVDAMSKLAQLAQFDLHSIEQPIHAGQWNEMSKLCEHSPLPIALDEELIGINDKAHKIELLEIIKPQYIILKPSLHGGIYGTNEWIQLAEKRHIGWWITSALESNIGLNAIAQWTATFNPQIPQGLGTGALFTDNIESALYIKGDCLWCKESPIDFHLNKS